MASRAEEKTTMVNALREEPGSYTRTLENGAEVIYQVQATNGGFTAGWEHVADSTSSHEKEFSSHADALRYLEENFDAPLEEGR